MMPKATCRPGARARRVVAAPSRASGMWISASSISAALTRLLTSVRVGQAELEEDRVDVLLDGALGEEQRLGDRGVALALGDLAEHLALARRQLVERRVLGAAARVYQRLDDLGVDHRPAVGDGADRGRQLGAVVHALLEQVGAAVGALARAARARRSGSENWLSTTTPISGWRVAQLGGEPDAVVGVRRRHADVGEHDVGALAVARRRAATAGRRPLRRPRRRGRSSSSCWTPSRTIRLSSPSATRDRHQHDPRSRRGEVGITRTGWCAPLSPPASGANVGRGGGMSAPIRIATVDDQRPFLDAARALVSGMPEFELVGESEDGEGALHLVHATRSRHGAARRAHVRA